MQTRALIAGLALPLLGTPTLAALPDHDGDGIPDELDNCPSGYDPTQADSDADGVGDHCDCGLDVWRTEDGGPNSLRAALESAGADCTVRAPAGTYTLSLGPLDRPPLETIPTGTAPRRRPPSPPA